MDSEERLERLGCCLAAFNVYGLDLFSLGLDMIDRCPLCDGEIPTARLDPALQLSKVPPYSSWYAQCASRAYQSPYHLQAVCCSAGRRLLTRRSVSHRCYLLGSSLLIVRVATALSLPRLCAGFL